MKVAVIGTQNCQIFDVQAILDNLPEDCSCIVSGGAEGIDSFAQQAAEMQGIPFRCFQPDYSRYGKSAPIVRNEEIVNYADMVLAFWDFKSKGTANTIAQCIEKGVAVRVIGLDQCCKET